MRFTYSLALFLTGGIHSKTTLQLCQLEFIFLQNATVKLLGIHFVTERSDFN